MRKKIEFLTISKWKIVILVFLLVACGPPSTSTAKIDFSPFQGGCSPPCWHGIVPGTTTEQEAITIIENLPFVIRSYSEQLDEYYLDYGVSSYRFLISNEVWRGGATTSENGIVGLITLGVELPLSDFAENWGEPQHLAILENDSGAIGYQYWFFYPEQGIYIKGSIDMHSEDEIRDFMGGATPSSSIKIFPELLIYSVHFFAPKDDIVEALSSHYGRDYWLWDVMREWEGYKFYDMPR